MSVHRGESDLGIRSVYKSCWCIANALFGEVWGWQALLCSPRMICLQAVKHKCIWPGAEGCVCRQNHQVSKKMLPVIGSADWIQSQVLLKAKLLKWRTEYTFFFFLSFLVQHNEWRKYSWWMPFLSLLVVFFLLSVDEISVFLQGTNLLLLNQFLLQLSLQSESVGLQVPNTEELLADPTYQTVVFTYLRRENQETANKKCL